MKRRLALLAITLLAFAGVAPAADIIDGVAAIVNDKVITYSQVRELVEPVAQQLHRNFSGEDLVEQVRKAETDALDQLIERTLIIQEFTEKGYKIPDTAIEQQINDIISSDYGGNRGAFVKTLEAENLTLSQYRDQTRERVIIQAMRSHKTQQTIVVSPYKIEKYYQANLDQYKVGEEIKLRLIFIKRGEPVPAATFEATPPASTNQLSSTNSEASATTTNAQTATDAPTTTVSQATTIVTNASDVTVTNAATNISSSETNALTSTNAPAAPAPPAVDTQRKLAEEILSKLDAGDSFESLARVYSEGKEAKDGGDWGWIGKDVLRKELNEIAFSLKAGEHSRVIETAEGYYILRIEDVRPAHVVPLTEVRDDIEKILLQQERAKVQDDWIKGLRAKAYIRLF